MKSPIARSRVASIGIVAAVAAGSCYHYAPTELIDDAFIFFRYAANFVGGHGLVFNPGERVEGYTSFLWALLLSGATLAEIDLEVASRVLGGLFAVLTAVALFGFLPEGSDPRPPWSRLLAPALLALDPAWSLWAVHGLETALFALCVTVALKWDLKAQAADAPSTLAPLAWALATLARPEGLLLFGASTAYGIARRPRSVLSRGAMAGIASYVVLVGGHFAWRVAYYGSFFANTFYAKVGLTGAQLSRGIGYLGQFFLDRRALLFLLLLPAAWVARKDARVRFLSWMAAVYLAGVAYEGGDAFPAFRFVVPILPVLYVLVQEGACAIARGASLRWGPGRWRGALAAAVLILVAGFHFQRLYAEAEAERKGVNLYVGGMKQVGKALRERFPSETVIALNPVGAIPFITGFRTIDMLGLTDLHIARTVPIGFGSRQAGHEKGDGSYVLSRRPDLILLGNVLVRRTVPVPLSRFRWPVINRSEQELSRLPELDRLYQRESMPIGGDLHLLYLRRKGFHPTLHP